MALLVDRSRRERLVSEVRKRIPPDFRPSEPWTLPDVRDAAASLDARIREAHARDLAREDRRRLEHAQTALDRLRETHAPLEAAVRDAATHTPVDKEWIGHFLVDAQQWRERREHLARAENRLRDAEADHADREVDLARALAPWDAHADADSLRERLRDELDRRAQAHTLRVRAEALAEKIETAQNDLREICERNHLPPDQWQTLHTREQKRADWETLRQRLGTLDARLRDLDAKLADHPDWISLDRETLEAKRQSADEAREALKEQSGTLTRLEHSIDQAKRGREVHRLREELDRRRRDLEADREAALHLRVLRETLSWLRDTVRQRQRPRVLESARHHLARFTGGGLALDLDFTADGETFRAGQPGRPSRPLDTLSGGERAQLLMAVRLAFLAQQEPAPMPLFVDEALGTSDDRRANAILHTLIDIAKQGRQLFYFTAQTDEIGKWQRALEAEDLDPALIDLAARRAKTVPASFAPPEPADLSTPDPARRADETETEWAARLGLPAWDPHQSIDTAPLPPLLWNEEADLVNCLRHGVATWGRPARPDRRRSRRHPRCPRDPPPRPRPRRRAGRPRRRLAHRTPRSRSPRTNPRQRHRHRKIP